jgi:hypothetical protein
MKKNLGTIDKMLRISFALIVAALYLVDAISGLVAIILGTISLIFVVTSFINFCPLYWTFGFSTAETRKAKRKR